MCGIALNTHLCVHAAYTGFSVEHPLSSRIVLPLQRTSHALVGLAVLWRRRAAASFVSSNRRLSDATHCRSRCAFLRRWPLASSQGLPLFAPHVGQGTTNICFGVSPFVFTRGYDVTILSASCFVED